MLESGDQKKSGVHWGPPDFLLAYERPINGPEEMARVRDAARETPEQQNNNKTANRNSRLRS
jgi:hypothetical protein